MANFKRVENLIDHIFSILYTLSPYNFMGDWGLKFFIEVIKHTI